MRLCRMTLFAALGSAVPVPARLRSAPRTLIVMMAKAVLPTSVRIRELVPLPASKSGQIAARATAAAVHSATAQTMPIVRICRFAATIIAME